MLQSSVVRSSQKYLPWALAFWAGYTLFDVYCNKNKAENVLEDKNYCENLRHSPAVIMPFKEIQDVAKKQYDDLYLNALSNYNKMVKLRVSIQQAKPSDDLRCCSERCGEYYEQTLRALSGIVDNLPDLQQCAEVVKKGIQREYRIIVGMLMSRGAMEFPLKKE